MLFSCVHRLNHRLFEHHSVYHDFRVAAKVMTVLTTFIRKERRAPDCSRQSSASESEQREPQRVTMESKTSQACIRITIDAFYELSDKVFDEYRAKSKNHYSKYWDHLNQATLSRAERARDFDLVAKVVNLSLLTDSYLRESQYLPEVVEFFIHERSHCPVNSELDEILQSEYWRYTPTPQRKHAHKKNIMRKKRFLGRLPTISE